MPHTAPALNLFAGKLTTIFPMPQQFLPTVTLASFRFLTLLPVPLNISACVNNDILRYRAHLYPLTNVQRGGRFRTLLRVMRRLLL